MLAVRGLRRSVRRGSMKDSVNREEVEEFKDVAGERTSWVLRIP
jgi:hypothetical protein